MGDHDKPAARPNPVVLLDILKAGLAVAVAYGWLRADDPRIGLVITFVWLLLSGALTLVTRGLVTPTSDPRDGQGAELQPVPEPPP